MTKETKRILLQVGLFLATFITTTFAGAEWCFGKSVFALSASKGIGFNAAYSWADFVSGMQFSVPFLLILTVHEFGHYFVSMYHKIKASLPYYIPFPPNPLIPSIGTFGAVIRIEEKVRSNRQHFDIGLAGPLAGFIVAIAVIIYGYATLPPADYIFTVHPEYKQYGFNYAEHAYNPISETDSLAAMDFNIGTPLVYTICNQFIADKNRIPNSHELMHYPFLLAGFIALFFTSLNLLPIGQLDGGHVTYGLFGGKGHRIIASVFFVLFIFYAGLGVVKVGMPASSLVWRIPMITLFNYTCFAALMLPARRDSLMYALLMLAVQILLCWAFPKLEGYTGWLLFGFIISRFIGIQHPPSEIEEPLDAKRIVLGWFTLLIFILCFSLAPLDIYYIKPITG
ncbi:site-2 protease family protein [Ohtaekwangia sp.]|uniref:site-2 protease family protein n=1 Tax=Ohtaekwangia sp. TaxID=2066019 RepID=UPI002F92CA7C